MTNEAATSANSSRPRRRRVWLRRLLWLAAILLMFLAVQAWHTRNAVDGPAPELPTTDVYGNSVSLEALRGKPAIIHFWATWCGTCSAMHGAVEGVAEDSQVITIASQSGRDEHVRAFLEQNEYNVAVVADPGGQLARRYGVTAFPTTFFLDAEGAVDHAEVGYTTEWGLRTRLWLTW